jgi:hypothetical protein
MELTDPLDIYACHLGALWGRLMSLEVLLRITISGGQFKAPLTVKAGEDVDQDAINRWAYLSSLIPEYNNIVVRASHANCAISGDEIVALRNALAHGIAISTSPSPPLRLVKFGKLDHATGKVKVDFAGEMSDEWLKQQQVLVQRAIDSVATYIKATNIAQ